MKTLTVPVPMETKFGLLYVTIGTAETREYHRQGHGDVVDVRPILQFSTNEEFDTGQVRESWMIRGRAYSVNMHVFKEDFQELAGAHGNPRERWHRCGYQPYRGGFRNDRGGEVAFLSATYEAMWEAVKGAADEFEGANPQWGALSEYLMHRHHERGSLGKLKSAREEVERHEGEARRHRERCEETASRLPRSLRDTVRD